MVCLSKDSFKTSFTCDRKGKRFTTNLSYHSMNGFSQIN